MNIATGEWTTFLPTRQALLQLVTVFCATPTCQPTCVTRPVRRPFVCLAEAKFRHASMRVFVHSCFGRVSTLSVRSWPPSVNARLGADASRRTGEWRKSICAPCGHSPRMRAVCVVLRFASLALRARCIHRISNCTAQASASRQTGTHFVSSHRRWQRTASSSRDLYRRHKTFFRARDSGKLRAGSRVRKK
jgi:hypothetical protein